jgi:hypothetical protein
MQPVDACRPAAPPRDFNCYAGRSDEKRLGRSELAPARLGRFHQLELDGRDSEKTIRRHHRRHDLNPAKALSAGGKEDQKENR